MIIVLLLLFIVVILWLGAASAGINSLTGGINGLTRSLKKKTMKEDLLKARAEAQALREALAQAQGQGQPLAKSNTPIPKAGSLAPQHEPPLRLPSHPSRRNRLSLVLANLLPTSSIQLWDYSCLSGCHTHSFLLLASSYSLELLSKTTPANPQL
jgi:hypothetical protein